MDFQELNFPKFNILNSLFYQINFYNIPWKFNQICLNTVVENDNNTELGCGSLQLDWDNWARNNPGKLPNVGEIACRKENLKERDFVFLCNQFKNTELELIYNFINANFKVGRVRIVRNLPHTCLSWHKDDTIRLHFPIKTNERCKMVIDTECKHLPLQTWWLTNTLKYHTAFNGSTEERIHLIASIIQQ